MKICVIIPSYNHVAALAALTQAALAHGSVLVVDDGSTVPFPRLPGCAVVRLERNRGKGAALRAGFKHAAAAGFSHAVTMDADGQHFPEDLRHIIAAAKARPEALVIGQRDFFAAGAPAARRHSNAASTLWFRVESGIRLADTQCGFRCYPLAVMQRLKMRSGRFAFELEAMVRASWLGTPIIPVPIRCAYRKEQLRQSHFRPFRDLAHITMTTLGLSLQSWFTSRSCRISEMALSRQSRNLCASAGVTTAAASRRKMLEPLSDRLSRL